MIIHVSFRFKMAIVASRQKLFFSKKERQDEEKYQ